MRNTDIEGRLGSWTVDYGAASTKTIEWLGDRYVLAQPVKRLPAASDRKVCRRPAAAAGHS